MRENARPLWEAVVVGPPWIYTHLEHGGHGWTDAWTADATVTSLPRYRDGVPCAAVGAETGAPVDAAPFRAFAGGARGRNARARRDTCDRDSRRPGVGAVFSERRCCPTRGRDGGWEARGGGGGTDELRRRGDGRNRG